VICVVFIANGIGLAGVFILLITTGVALAVVKNETLENWAENLARD
jgi:hypothetical protein